MAFAAAYTHRLVQIAEAAAQAGHGRKGAVYAKACEELGISHATLMRALGRVSDRPARKRRADAGQLALSRDEAELIATVLMESLRKNGKRLLSIGQAVATLRANGLVRAEMAGADGATRPLSESTVARALRHYCLHPSQLLQPAPAVRLRSLHPNHVWQIDASLCVLYYLQASTPEEAGLQVMDARKFYKNKPANLKRIEHERVWSYEVTDHFSGSIFCTYVLGAESGFNLAESFLACIQPRMVDGQAEPMHGVPQVVMLDMGSAMTGALFKNLARRLCVQLLPHKARNPRATGQVEKARDIIERSFESALRFQPVHSLDALNTAALAWARWFGATQIHGRHGMPRHAAWQTITAEQLRLAPPPALCRELLTHAPERRKVNDFLEVEFKGHGHFSVRRVPRVYVGEWLNITYNPYDLVDGLLRSAMVVEMDAEGREVLRRIPRVDTTAGGFAATANVIGQDWQAAPATVADTNRQRLELLAMDATTPAEAQARRKAKALPLGGRLDPFKHITATPVVSWLPKRGVAMVPAVIVADSGERVYTLFQAAGELVRRGLVMDPERNALVAQWHPDGVPEGALDDLMNRLHQRAALRVVGGQGRGPDGDANAA